MWVDNTVAYNARYATDVHSYRFLCGKFGPDYDQVIVNTDCQKPDVYPETLPLCERVHTLKEHRRPQRIELANPGNSTFPASHVTCRDRQVTLAFLPCEGSSRDAYVSDDVRSGSPPGSADPEAPSFQCSNAVQHVPYTLLCDHRQDCSDNSDEDFCRFPPCSGDTPMKCGSSDQVSCVHDTLCIPCGKLGPPYLGKTTAAARAALPCPTSACCQVFSCFRNSMHGRA